MTDYSLGLKIEANTQAIRDQNKIIKDQSKLLERIAFALEVQAHISE